MPGVKAKSGLAGKLGGKLHEAVNTHREDETTFGGGGGLPGGIEGGIAQVVECKFGVYEKGDNKGEYFFYAAATVIQPKSVSINGESIHIQGQRTQIGPEPICDTPGKTRATLDEHVAWVLNEYRKLGVDTTQLGADDLEPTAEAIKAAGIFTRFRTSVMPREMFEKKDGKVWVVKEDGSGKPKGPYADQAKAKAANPYAKEPKEITGPANVYQQWTGAVPDFQPELASGVVDEGSKTSVETNAAANGQQPWDKDAANEAATATDDIEALLAAAGAEDETAMERLKELALAAGKTDKDVKEADSWEQVAGWITGGEAPSGDEAGSGIPEKDSVWFYKPIVGVDKNKKLVKAKKAVECIVLSVDEKAETVTLKNSETGKTIIGGNKKPLAIPFADLEQGE